MKPIIRLKDFIQEMDVFGDEERAYLNIRTGEFVTLSDEELITAEEGDNMEDLPEWRRKSIQKAEKVLSDDDYQALPDKFEIHEYSIMKSFCYSVEDEALRDRLLRSIRGRGAFRYFKDTIHEHDIADDWYGYRERAFKRIAIEWLVDHNLEYTEEEDE